MINRRTAVLAILGAGVIARRSNSAIAGATVPESAASDAGARREAKARPEILVLTVEIGDDVRPGSIVTVHKIAPLHLAPPGLKVGMRLDRAFAILKRHGWHLKDVETSMAFWAKKSVMLYRFQHDSSRG